MLENRMPASIPLAPLGADPLQALVQALTRALANTRPGLQSPVIVDGGANKGRTVDALLALSPGCALRAYEPIPELARKLVRRFQDRPDVLVRPVALGSGPGVLPLNVLDSRTCSSFLEPTGIRAKHADKQLDVLRRVEVEVVRLDDEPGPPPDAIKLDLQGYEMEALRGAQGVLDHVAVVLCEVSFRPMYAGQPLAEEVLAWMRERGFRARELYAPWREPDGALAAADALFVKV